MRLLTGMILALLISMPAAATAKSPNILLIFADDQRADTIGAWGNEHIKTPNIDSLVNSGTSFRNNYCFGGDSGAVCIPSRAMLHTGRTWMHSNHQMKGEVTLGELLRSQGYRTFATGKWHNGKEALLRSFENGKNVFMGGMCDHLKVPISNIENGDLVSKGQQPNSFSSTLFADAVIEFLKSPREDQPFFAYLAFTAPHDPRNPPEAYREMYYQKRPPLPENFLPQLDFDNGSLVIRDEVLAAWPRDPNVIRDQLSEYYGLVTHMDDQIGRVLKALDETGERDNTIIVYAADHGLAMGSHGLLGKQNLFEHSMKCPLIFVGPGIPAGKSSEAFSYLLDIYPTLCGQLGVSPPERVEGKDLSGIIAGKSSQVRESVFLPYQNSQRTVRDERWKLCVYPKINYHQLFDLSQDPFEKHNLAEDPAHQKTVDRMFTLLREWQTSMGDETPLTVDKPGPRTRDLSQVVRKPDAHQPEWIVEKYFPE